MLRISPSALRFITPRVGFLVHRPSGCLRRFTELSCKRSRSEASAPHPKHPRSAFGLGGQMSGRPHFTGGGSGQPMQIAARREGNTPFISPELDPIPQVFASTTMTRS
jgi:hypothetical protein